MAMAIFYASSTGNTSNVAQQISEKLGGVEVFDIASEGVSKISEFDKVIIGASTWGEGDLQDDWDDAWSDFGELDFSGKTVALFGLGDQEDYPRVFVDAMGTIHNKVKENGATIIGGWSTEGYEFDESKAVHDGEFVGLALDEDNQFDLTEERISQWCEQIRSSML